MFFGYKEITATKARELALKNAAKIEMEKSAAKPKRVKEEWKGIWRDINKVVKNGKLCCWFVIQYQENIEALQNKGYLVEDTTVEGNYIDDDWNMFTVTKKKISF